ncbi:hypothetical protein HZS55_21805 [Halosimplex rubrum]|uniref:Uncharacterized protein n=1 Tax=Halosimplex rubrum TaxID=869889 RepID=A0A7D5SSM6_9EURY|nr:hypothetical protein [Halosimplex rubrum]QLH79767.1 hypothetical protein HZS55_21805 [Halosimplex rubrum]
MRLARTGAVLSGLAGIGFGLLGQILPPPPSRFAERPNWMTALIDLSVPLVVLAVVLYLIDRGTVGRLLGGRGDGVGGVLGGSRTVPLNRYEIIEATNWKRLNWIRLRRSLGVALTVAGTVALLVSLTAGNSEETGGIPGGAMSLLWFGAILLGLAVVVTSRTDGEEVAADYTHRVSVRIPDLFSLHSFHVHLRQITEDLGYVPTSDTSPGRGGSAAAFDEEVYLSKGGFKVRKRPFESSLSPLPDDSPMAEVLNLTTASLSLVAVGVSLLVTGPQVAGVPLLLVGAVAFLYDYVRRTRQWAELYCIEEGTVYTPTAAVHDGEPPGEGVVHHEPAVSAAESSTELLVTLGAKHSVYFAEDRLAADFEDFVERLDDVAAENSYTVVDEPTRERVAASTNGR